MNRRAGSIGRLIIAVAATAAFSFPLYIAVVNAFKTNESVVQSPLALPIDGTLSNVLGVLTDPSGFYWRSLGTSLVLTAACATLITGVAAMLAYYLARRAGRWGSAVLVVLLIGLMIPQALILGGVSDVLRGVGLMGTPAGLVLFNLGYFLPFAVFLFHGFVKALPRDTEEAAVIDGAGPLRSFWQVVFPQLRPAAASVVVFVAVFVWNDFITPLILLSPSTGTTITVGVYRAIGTYNVDYGGVYATMLLAAIPMVLFYLLLQKQFIKGLTAGTSK